MFDIAIALDNRPGTLAALGEAMGAACVSLEGGGVFACGGKAFAHFLVADGERARTAAKAAGLRVEAVREVLARRLDQERPGQLGAIGRALAGAGVNVEVMYSDHDGRLILVCDDMAAAAKATAAWAA